MLFIYFLTCVGEGARGGGEWIPCNYASNGLDRLHFAQLSVIFEKKISNQTVWLISSTCVHVHHTCHTHRKLMLNINFF